MKKDKTAQFIEKALKVSSHKNELGEHKFSYEHTIFSTTNKKLVVTCLTHGDLEVFPQAHLSGDKCMKCFREEEARKRKEKFPNFLEKVFSMPSHKDENGEHKYTYEKVDYKNMKTKIIITCKIHGDFDQTPRNHLKGSGCSFCGKEKMGLTRRLGTKKFIEKASVVEEHQNPDGSLKYDYSKVNYLTQKQEVEIICPIHGSFFQYPNSHLSGCGCFKCGHLIVGSYHKKSQEDFIEEIVKHHGNKYDLSKVDYQGKQGHVILGCSIHGDFIIPARAIDKGCQKCAIVERDRKRRVRHAKEFFKNAPVIHQGKYDYSLVEYTTRRGRIKIICPEHGEFIQQVHHHLLGSGCSKCSSSRGEKRVDKYLKEKNLNYQFEVPWCYKPKKKPLSFDFVVFLESGKEVRIAYDGEHHFRSIKGLGGDKKFKRFQETDELKNEYCRENNIPLLRIPYWDFENIEILLEKFIKEQSL